MTYYTLVRSRIPAAASVVFMHPKVRNVSYCQIPVCGKCQLMPLAVYIVQHFVYIGGTFITLNDPYVTTYLKHAKIQCCKRKWCSVGVFCEVATEILNIMLTISS